MRLRMFLVTLSRFNQIFLARMVTGRAPSAPAHSAFIIHVRTNCEATYAEAACFHASHLIPCATNSEYCVSAFVLFGMKADTYISVRFPKNHVLRPTLATL
ncbi:hypothetical protein I7I50_08430 [Histoplasma capsulatum G186AR]|uniref:Secreted protein n=1 Tax=Ajellomyces capsulatus TaxID=5037 RepID=A0A8H7YR11_AJECA|nr:hypothetical protein I7I52_05945 [Histoplasma capsulatum]QSS73597.1 hypothetical protein I7I50_08430 [Histoplasma capsulatum G186AR]